MVVYVIDEVMMEPSQKENKSISRAHERRLFCGLLLVIVGVILLLEELEVINFGQKLANYWPAIFILIGFLIYIARGARKSGSALFLILLGTFMILIKIEKINRYLWPSLLILVGLWLLFRPGSKQKIKTTDERSNQKQQSS
jgi:Ca2+/Na+ antiporter